MVGVLGLQNPQNPQKDVAVPDDRNGDDTSALY